MTAPVVAFFNNKGGVGKTSLVYHVAWMLAEQGHRVIAADLDPQANLTAAFLDDGELEELWPTPASVSSATIFGCVAPLIRGIGDVIPPTLMPMSDGLSLIPGDIRLSTFEDDLSSQWPDCLDGKERAFRVISAFWRVIMMSAEECGADIVLMDVGPNLGAINRAALFAADHVVIPLSPDLFSVQGLVNLGPTLRRWRTEWAERLRKNPAPGLVLPIGAMCPQGYVLLQHGVRLGVAVNAYQRWMDRIPTVYRESVLDVAESVPSIDDDPYCLAQLKHYRSLMPMAQEARKPVFLLTPADGAFGGHQQAVAAARADFEQLSARLLQGVASPAAPRGSGAARA